MRRIGAFLGILVSLQAYAQTLPTDQPYYVAVEHGLLHVPVGDGGTTQELNVGPGLYLNEPAVIKTSQIMESLKAENQSLKKSLNEAPPPSTSWPVLVGVGVVCLLAGGYVGLKIAR